MTMKISIIGIAKSGTSALYSSIKTALPAPRRILFEPANAAELAYVTAGEENGMTKLMFGAMDRQNYEPALFTHRVAIVRDPRDMIVSSTLFRFNRLKLLNNDALFKRLVKLFEKKETDPRSISVCKIVEGVEAGEAQAMKNYFTDKLNKYSDYLDGGDQHILTFDQMVGGDFDALNAYLGLTLTPPPPLDGWVSKISRKGESGDWKNWFTPEDVAFFRDSMDPFITKYGFDPAWTLASDPVIEPQHCSQYIRRLSDARKIDPNLKRDVGSDMAALLSAAEDGKVNAMTKLVEIYEDDASKDFPAAIAICNQLGEMGYTRFFVKAGRIALKDRNRHEAYSYLEKAIVQDLPQAYFILGNQYLRPINKGKYAEGIALLEKGAQLGSKACITRLEELATQDKV